jgi:hypothetical protein
LGEQDCCGIDECRLARRRLSEIPILHRAKFQEQEENIKVVEYKISLGQEVKTETSVLSYSFIHNASNGGGCVYSHST